MSWGIKQNKIFPQLVDFGHHKIRELLDLQYLSIILAEKFFFLKEPLGTVLDFGSGARDLEKRWNFSKYFSLDPFVNADWNSMSDVPEDKKFDLIAALEVFEHLSNPKEVLEFFRSHQKKGQRLYITTPFLAREHGAPKDYYRWTEEGLKSLLQISGYHVDCIIKRGDLLCVISSFLNYTLFRILNSRWFLLGGLLLPLVLLVLFFAQLSLRCGFVKPQDFYLGISILATKASD